MNAAHMWAELGHINRSRSFCLVTTIDPPNINACPHYPRCLRRSEAMERIIESSREMEAMANENPASQTLAQVMLRQPSFAESLADDEIRAILEVTP